MKVHKFEGATMRDAIAKVKAELGDQAVIIATRQIKKGLLGGTAIEISAAIDDHQDEPSRAPAFTQAFRARESYERAEKTDRERDREPAPDVEKLINPIRSEMRSLRAMVRASDASRGNADLKNEVAELRKLVEQLSTRPAAAALAPKPSKVSIPAKRPSMATMLTAPSKGNVLMLVGPTGAGKTTTIAKLAARAALIENKRVRLITLDNYRVGGVDQIRTFADLIGVPLVVAESPAELAGILADGEDEYDLTLVDTAGRSPRDTTAIVELAAEIGNCPPIEVHVVIPAGTSHVAIDALLTRFTALQPSRLLVTKIDEVDVPADLATLPTRTGLPITWITTGQAVPEDIEEPSPARLLDIASNGLGTANSSNTRVA